MLKKKVDIDSRHPLRRLFKTALDFGFRMNPAEKPEISYYIEEQILCHFIHIDNLLKIRNAEGKSLEDIADMLAESDVMFNARSFSREIEVHKHIGDYTLFMLGMFPSALSGRKGREFILGRIIVPGGSLPDLYALQGKRSYRIVSEFAHRELFMELSSNFLLYKNVLELVRIYLESVKSREFLKVKEIIGGTG